MTAVTYVAKRSLVAGHVVNNTYSINIPVVSMPTNRTPSKEVQQSLALVRETIYFGASETYAVQTAALTPAQVIAVKEFLDSVEDGSTFTFDPYGSVNTPVSPLTAEIDSNGYPGERISQGRGGADDMFRFSFTVRVVT